MTGLSVRAIWMTGTMPGAAASRMRSISPTTRSTSAASAGGIDPGTREISSATVSIPCTRIASRIASASGAAMTTCGPVGLAGALPPSHWSTRCDGLLAGVAARDVRALQQPDGRRPCC